MKTSKDKHFIACAAWIAWMTSRRLKCWFETLKTQVEMVRFSTRNLWIKF